MNRFNTLLLGEPERVIEELESETETTVDDLRVAFINAMGRIDKLEQELEQELILLKSQPSSSNP